MGHDYLRYGVDIIGRLVEVAVVVTYQTLVHRTEAFGDIGLLGADKLSQVIVILDGSEERSIEFLRRMVGE